MAYSGLNPTFPGTVTSGQVLQAATGIDTSTGDIIATAGNVVANGNITATTGNLILSAGYIEAGTTPFIFVPPLGGVNNLFIGENHTTGNLDVPGDDNTAIGSGTLNSLGNTSTASYNTMVGAGSGNQISSGKGNVGIGVDALVALTTGNANIAIGTSSAGAGTIQNLVTGSTNIAIGVGAGSSYTGAESSNIIIGTSTGTTGESNKIRIGVSGSGAGQQNATFIAGIAGVTVASSAAVLINTSTGQLGTVASTARLKENIKDMGPTNVMKLRPVTFNFKHDESKSNQYGLIAEEVAKVMPDIVIYDEAKQPLSVQYHLLPAILLNEIQKLNKRIEALEAK
jgi:trimeric autotransporter adhesin